MAQRFDIHIQTLPAAEQKATGKYMSFGFTSAIGVKGFQMLINQWIKTLLTPVGSDPADVDSGTTFSTLRNSNFGVSELQDMVAMAVEQCNDQVFAAQQQDFTLTASERLATADIIEFVVSPSGPGFDVSIEINNQAGENLEFNLPVLGDV